MEETGDYIDNILSLRKAKATTAKLIFPSGQMIELLKYNSHSTEQRTRKIYEIGISHIAFTIDDLGVEYKKLKNKEV